MKVLVTGAAGFIGSYLSRSLLTKGISVIGIDNFHPYYDRRAKEWNLDLVSLSIHKEPTLFTQKDDKATLRRIWDKISEYTLTPDQQSYTDSGSFTFYECDIRDNNKLKKIFREESISHIIHLAAMAGVPYSIKDPKLYTEVNIDGTVTLLDLAVKNKIENFIFASSSSVYGATTEIPFSENQNVDDPISPYAATKRMAEIMCYTYSYLHKLPIICLRFFTVYGPLQRPYGMAIQKFIKLTHQGKPMTVYGDGKMGRDFTFVSDTVSGIESALHTEQPYAIYNLGNSSPVTVNEITDIIKAKMKKGTVEYLPQPPTEVPITYADISKAHKELGYSPEVDIEEGISKQVEIFLDMPAWYQDMPG
jgi:UDP-glucuronate 4-epimerase